MDANRKEIKSMQAEKVYQGNQVEIFRVSPALYFRKATLERGQCNSIFLVGSTGVAVVDVPTPQAAEELKEEAKLLFHKPITTVFLTHGDGDHGGGCPAFFSKDVTIFCSRRLFGMFRTRGARLQGCVCGGGRRRAILPARRHARRALHASGHHALALGHVCAHPGR